MVDNLSTYLIFKKKRKTRRQTNFAGDSVLRYIKRRKQVSSNNWNLLLIQSEVWAKENDRVK